MSANIVSGSRTKRQPHLLSWSTHIKDANINESDVSLLEFDSV